MSNPSLTTREKLLQAAFQLFTSQGISGTTTKQIAELAAVNEVTLFRQFGHKYGLLQALIEVAVLPNQINRHLQVAANAWDPQANVVLALRGYASAWLETLASAPEFVRSIIGEAGQFPPENRRVLGQGFAAIHQDLAEQLCGLPNSTGVEAEALAGLLLSGLLGYAVVEFTCDGHPVWANREAFLADLVKLADSVDSLDLVRTLPNQAAESPGAEAAVQTAVADLPAPLVHGILQQARKCGLQDFALAYLLFGAGLSAAELVGLQRNQQIQVMRQQLIQITSSGPSRQVPVNQWILGQRYGAPNSNPITRWLRSRKDGQGAMFLDAQEQPLTLAHLQSHWQTWTVGLMAPNGQPPTLTQTQDTWRVEMLNRGMSLENLSLLTGITPAQLQPYARRAQEILALEQAAQLDRKGGK